MDERARLLAEARAFLEWERELGGIGYRRQARRTSASVSSVSLSRDASPPTPKTTPGRAPEAERVHRLTVLATEAAACSSCRLHAGRTKSVFARGSHGARLAFVGEGPGYNEDQQGSPFVGEAGQLLDKMIVAMGYGPDEVYICNAVKCRPPENRTPEPDEMAACAPFLAEQLTLVAPEIIVALGRTAAEALAVMPGSGRGWRGQWSEWNGIRVMSTYHPAYLLRSPDQKRVVWDDLRKVMAALGTTAPR